MKAAGNYTSHPTAHSPPHNQAATSPPTDHPQSAPPDPLRISRLASVGWIDISTWPALGLGKLLLQELQDPLNTGFVTLFGEHAVILLGIARYLDRQESVSE